MGEPGQPDDREVVGHVGDLDPHEELHPLEECHQGGASALLGVSPERLAVVDAGEAVLDPPLRRQQQHVGGRAGCQALEVLGRERVQPGEPVGTGDGDDVAVRQVDEGRALDEPALLG
jgi:hypothetical protein